MFIRFTVNEFLRGNGWLAFDISDIYFQFGACYMVQRGARCGQILELQTNTIRGIT